MKNTLKAIMAVLSLTLVLSACGSKSGGEGTADSTATPPADTTVSTPAPADTVPADTTKM